MEQRGVRVCEGRSLRACCFARQCLIKSQPNDLSFKPLMSRIELRLQEGRSWQS
jgi:hypothetical protein